MLSGSGRTVTVAALAALGASVRRVPAFVAKHPYRVVVSAPLAERALAFVKEAKKTRNARRSDTKA